MDALENGSGRTDRQRNETRAVIRFMAVKAAIFVLLPMAAAAVAVLVLM